MDSQAEKSSLKLRISYSELAWAAAFARIEEGQKLSADGTLYRVIWKHIEPEWVQLEYKVNKALVKRMVRPGDPLLLELRPE